ncbi:MAG: ABC transporter ATP-binding protein [Armatimonadota bacterium]
MLANDRIHFAVRTGEIRALLGENGAGKTTLVSILAGLYQPDEGDIRWRGRRVAIRSPREAARLGIGMVHQHFKLVLSFTVTENVMLGLAESGPSLREVAQRLTALGREYRLEVDPSARVWQLSVGEQQRVELLRQLYLGAQLLILDEPTATLTPQESQELFNVLQFMADQGHGIILITHKLPEVMAAAHTITVLRQGRVVANLARHETDEQRLASLMVGRSPQRLSPRSRVLGPPLLSLHGISCMSDRGLLALSSVDLEVRAGSIVGIAAVAGNGQKELSEVCTGLRPVSGGRVLVDERDLTGAGPAIFFRAGVTFVPEDRLGTGLSPGLTVWENLCLRMYSLPPLCRRGMLNLEAARALAEGFVTRFGIVTPSLDVPVRYLSGGNLQKVVLAREISARPRVLVASFPTRGLDVASTELVQESLVSQAEAGVAVLLISEDLDELLLLSDRIVALYRGQIMGQVETSRADRQQIGLWMGGVRSDNLPMPGTQ